MHAIIRSEELQLSQELMSDILRIAEAANETCDELLQHALSEIRSLPKFDLTLARLSEAEHLVT